MTFEHATVGGRAAAEGTMVSISMVKNAAFEGEALVGFYPFRGLDAGADGTPPRWQQSSPEQGEVDQDEGGEYGVVFCGRQL